MKRAFTMLAAGGCLLASIPSPLACGFEDPGGADMARGLLNWSFPNALYVRSAVWRAQLGGVIPQVQQPGAVAALLGLSATARDLKTFGDVLSQDTHVPSPPSLSVVLIGPMLWSRLTAVNGAYTVNVHTNSAEPGDVVMVTDAPVLTALVASDLTPSDAEERGLLRYYGSDAEIEVARTLLKSAWPLRSKKSDQSIVSAP